MRMERLLQLAIREIASPGPRVVPLSLIRKAMNGSAAAKPSRQVMKAKKKSMLVAPCRSLLTATLLLSSFRSRPEHQVSRNTLVNTRPQLFCCIVPFFILLCITQPLFLYCTQTGPPTFVRVYRFDDSDDTWKPLGQGIFGRLATVNDPFAVDLCEDGTTLAISSLVPGSGYVEMYKYDDELKTWENMGSPIESQSTQEAVGITVSMSRNGKIVAFGTRLFESSNLVRVFEFISGSWVQVGADINSGGELNARRLSLSISGDGKRVAIGPQDKTPFSRVYGWDGAKWKQIGADIPSYELRPAGFQLQSIALSGDGDRVAVFAPGGESIAVYDEV